MIPGRLFSEKTLLIWKPLRAILPVWRSLGNADHDASSSTSGTRYLEAWAFSIYHIYLAIPQANTFDSVQLHLVMTKHSRFWTDNYVKLINAGRILDNRKNLPESLVLIRDIVMPNVFDLCGLTFTDKHYQLLYTQKSPWTEILPSLSRWSILQYKFDLLLL